MDMEKPSSWVKVAAMIIGGLVAVYLVLPWIGWAMDEYDDWVYCSTHELKDYRDWEYEWDVYHKRCMR